MARAIQHEIDHLDGKLIGDYANEEEVLQFMDQLESLKREQEK